MDTTYIVRHLYTFIPEQQLAHHQHGTSPQGTRNPFEQRRRRGDETETKAHDREAD